MKTPRLLAVGWISFVTSFSGIQHASAILPNLTEPPWLGYYAVHATNRFQFGITAQGKITLSPVGDKGQSIEHTLAVPVIIAIEEIMPDGKAVLKAIRTDTLETTDPATENLQKSVIRGKVTGDATFEVTLEESRGMISAGGRIVDPGTAIKNPLRFSIHARFPKVYANDKKLDKKDIRIFEKKVRSDRLDIKYTDGKSKKQTFADPVTAASPEVSGPGIAGVEIDIGAYKGKRFLFLASENSAITLWNASNAPLHKGFTLKWQPDTAKDKDGKARLTFELK